MTDEADHHPRGGDRPGRPRGLRRPPLRPLPRGVRGRRRLQALARQDGDRGRRPPLLPHHDEPPPAAHQRRLRGAVPAGPQRRRRAARLLAGARHERLRRLGQGDRQPRHRGAQAPSARLPRRHPVLRVRGARGAGVAVQARPRRREGPHAGAQPGRRARGGVQAPRAGAAQAPGRVRRRGQRWSKSTGARRTPTAIRAEPEQSRGFPPDPTPRSD